MRYYFDVRIGTNEVLDEQGSDGLDPAMSSRRDQPVRLRRDVDGGIGLVDVPHTDQPTLE